MEHIEQYKARRKARMDSRAIEEYRWRRDQRWMERLDAEIRADDEEETNNKGVSHGNTKIPFGLCLREGIKVDPKWGPKEAWEALEGKGYSAGEVYRQLKVTGTLGKSEKPKREPVKLNESHFYGGLIEGVYKKNTLEFAKFINEHCDDPDVSEFLSLANGTGAKHYPEIKVKRSMDGEGCHVRPSWVTSTGKPVRMEIEIPQISKGSTPEQKAQAARSFAHEYTHYLDYLAREKETVHDAYMEANKEFGEMLDRTDTLTYGETARKHFEEYKVGYNEIVDRYKKEYNGIQKAVADKMFETRPGWLDEDGKVMYSADYFRDRENVKKFEREVKKQKKECIERRNREKRGYMDGSVTLQGLYDAISGGRLRARGDVKYGHSEAYYKKNPGNRGMEALADYVALRATRPDLADIFRKDQPEIASALDNCLVEMIKRLRG